MKFLVRFVVCLCGGFFLGAPAFAQPRSVWIEDYTAEEVQAKVAAGWTTVIYCGGAVHADGPVIALGKHMFLCHYVAQRVAEELGNALVLPVNPYAVAAGQMRRASGTSGSNVAGTISLSDETYGLVTKDVVNTVLDTAGFKNAVIMGDHSQGQDTLRRAARDLDLAWKSKGVRAYYVDLAPTAKKYSIDYFKKLDIPNDPITDRYSRLDDDLQLMSIDRDRKWVREDKIPPEDRKVLSPDVGKMFVDRKIRTVVEQIQKLTAAGK